MNEIVKKQYISDRGNYDFCMVYYFSITSI